VHLQKLRLGFKNILTSANQLRFIGVMELRKKLIKCSPKWLNQEWLSNSINKSAQDVTFTVLILVMLPVLKLVLSSAAKKK